MKRILKTVEAPNRDYKGFQMFDSLYKKINGWALKDDIKESVLRSDHGYSDIRKSETTATKYYISEIRRLGKYSDF
jgi:hypothetical protein